MMSIIIDKNKTLLIIIATFTSTTVDFGCRPVFVSHSLADPSGWSLTRLIRADRLNAATCPGSRVAFRRQAGEHGGGGAAALQQATQGQSHARLGHTPTCRGSGLRVPLAFPFAGLHSPLGGRGAVQGHADGGRTSRGVGQEREGGRGGGRGEVTDAGVDGEVGDRSGEAAQL